MKSQQLTNQGRALFVMGLISLQVAAQRWGKNAPANATLWHAWWAPTVGSALIPVVLLMLHRLHREVPISRLLLLGVMAFATEWIGWALGAIGLPYQCFAVLSAVLILLAFVPLLCIFSERLRKKLSRWAWPLDIATSVLLLSSFYVTIVGSYAAIRQTVVRHWWPNLILLLGMIVSLIVIFAPLYDMWIDRKKRADTPEESKS